MGQNSELHELPYTGLHIRLATELEFIKDLLPVLVLVDLVVQTLISYFFCLYSTSTAEPVPSTS